MHFVDAYLDRLLTYLDAAVGGGIRFFKQQVFEVPDLLTGVVIEYDTAVGDNSRDVVRTAGINPFAATMRRFDPTFQPPPEDLLREMSSNHPEKTFCGWGGTTLWVLRAGQHAEHWLPENADKDAAVIFVGAATNVPKMIYDQLVNIRSQIPVGREHFAAYERLVRISFNYVFNEHLGTGHAQVRTEPENEGVEIRDIIFSNVSRTGFWADLKNKYGVSEVVVDAKNTDDLSRADLRQLYCYLKPALGLWGFLVCRARPSESICAFNRTLFKNFKQERGVTILCEDDLRRMCEQAIRGQDASAYLQKEMSEFLRSI